MSRILLLLVFMLWMAWPVYVIETTRRVRFTGTPADTLLFFAGYLALVGVMGLWSRLLTRRLSPGNLYPSVRRFNRAMELARAAVPLWLAAGMYLFDWKAFIYAKAGPVASFAHTIETPFVLLGTLPAFLAWIGLWWSQFPADRALREQSLLIRLDQALPVHAPPSFRSYFAANLRLQLLFTIVPVLLILLAKDLAGLLLIPFLPKPPSTLGSTIEALVMFGAAAAVFLVAPEILRRVLHTQPLPDSPLRQRLVAMCHRHNLRYRDILLWHTQGNMGNAAVMGVVPQMRYILLSDLLLESMTDEQIEAVFAHELGHIVHRHMLWYVLFVVILMLTLAGPGAAIEAAIPWFRETELGSVASMVLGVLLFIVTFGYVSRRFERQADVFAARTMERHYATVTGIATAVAPPLPAPAPLPYAPDADHAPATAVGPYGATVFASALERVAHVNNIPVSARSWCHGSIAKRMRYVHSLSHDPTHTHHFDRLMRRLYWLLIVSLLTAGIWTALVALRPA